MTQFTEKRSAHNQAVSSGDSDVHEVRANITRRQGTDLEQQKLKLDDEEILQRTWGDWERHLSKQHAFDDLSLETPSLS